MDIFNITITNQIRDTIKDTTRRKQKEQIRSLKQKYPLDLMSSPKQTMINYKQHHRIFVLVTDTINTNSLQLFSLQLMMAEQGYGQWPGHSDHGQTGYGPYQIINRFKSIIFESSIKLYYPYPSNLSLQFYFTLKFMTHRIG